MKYAILLIAVLAGVGGTMWLMDEPVPNAAQPEPVVQPEVIGEEPHPVSLASLMQNPFDGRDFVVGDVLAQEDVYTRYAISYRSGPYFVSGIMNVPVGDGPFPLLILNHGYIDTSVYTTGRGLKREQDYLARQGFVVIHPDYRNHAGSDDDPNNDVTLRIGYTEDVINVVYAVRAANLPYIDLTRIGMMGHSMGGGIAQNVAVVEPDLVDAIVLYAPVSGDAWEHFERYTTRRPEQAQTILDLYGPQEEDPEFWAGVSAETYYEAIEVPILIHIGTLDDSTPPQWSYDMAETLEGLGKDVTIHVYEGEGHEYGPQWGLFMERTAAFFAERLSS